MRMTRNTFLKSALGAVGALVAFGAVGCGSDDGGGDGAGGSGGTDCSGGIVGNHGHALTVSDADVAAGVDKTYDIQGNAGHTHQVTISAAQFAEIAQGKSVLVTTSEGSLHTHEVSVACA